MNNIQGTGVIMRLNYLLNETGLSTTRGYGIAVQRNIVGIDCGVRFQEYRSVFQQFATINSSTTIGLDLTTMISSRLTLLGSFESLQGFGANSLSLFLELSTRL